MKEHNRGRLLWAMVASVAMLAGCASPPSPSREPADLPIMAPTGTITSREFVRLFSENCVRGFPNDQAMGRAFLNDGFTESEFTRGMSEHGEWHLRRESDGLGAQIGTVVIVEKAAFNFAGDGLGSFYACTLTGDVSDPATFDAQVLAMVDATGKPLGWQGNGSDFDVRMERQGAIATLDVEPPSLNHVGGTPENLPSDCAGLVRCRTWGPARMHIWLPANSGVTDR